MTKPAKTVHELDYMLISLILRTTEIGGCSPMELATAFATAQANQESEFAPRLPYLSSLEYALDSLSANIDGVLVSNPRDGRITFTTLGVYERSIVMFNEAVVVLYDNEHVNTHYVEGSANPVPFTVRNSAISPMTMAEYAGEGTAYENRHDGLGGKIGAVGRIWKSVGPEYFLGY